MRAKYATGLPGNFEADLHFLPSLKYSGWSAKSAWKGLRLRTRQAQPLIDDLCVHILYLFGFWSGVLIFIFAHSAFIIYNHCQDFDQTSESNNCGPLDADLQFAVTVSFALPLRLFLFFLLLLLPTYSCRLLSTYSITHGHALQAIT